MKISKANLCFRFYTSEGWTRPAVANLLHSVDIRYVLPRYFDAEKDKAVSSINHVLEDVSGYEDCDYFAVLSTSVNAKFDEDKLSQHEIIGMSGLMSGCFGS